MNMVRIILYIISVLVNAAYFIVLRMDLYTDRYHLPDGKMGVHHRSPISSLYHADMNWLSGLEVMLMALSVVTSVLLLFGLKNSIVRIIQIVSTIASTIVFIIILLVAGNVRLKY